jgi:hypothetical protein
MAPQVVAHPGTRTRRDRFMATNRVPQPRHDDDSVEAHYACLERPCACIDGWIYLGRVVESQHDLDGEVVEYERVRCKRCQRRERA